MEKVYVFGNKELAKKFGQTAYALGYTPRHRVGSALVMSEEAYNAVIKQTHAGPATIIAQIERRIE